MAVYPRGGGGWWCLVVWALVGATMGLAQSGGPIRLGEIVERGRAGAIPVYIEAPVGEPQRQLLTAFNAHGAFRPVAAPEGAAYRLIFAAEGPSGAVVTVQAAGAAGPGATERVAGATAREAFFRAADRAVLRLTREPGIFTGRLAFTLERGGAREVLVSDLFLGEVQQVTNDRSRAITPKWSPDGSRILFTSYFRNGFPDIYLIDLASRRRSAFVSFRGTNTAARFSPSGREVALSLSGEGDPEIYVADAAGRGLRRLTRSPGVDTSPAWSPDGSQIVYTSDSGGSPQLLVVPAAGGSPQRLPVRLAGSRYFAEPTWSARRPNLIAFSARVAGGFQIAVFDRSTGTARVVSQEPGDAVEPVWTADGRHLVFTFRTANVRRLKLLDTESGRSTFLSAASFGLAAEADYLARP